MVLAMMLFVGVHMRVHAEKKDYLYREVTGESVNFVSMSFIRQVDDISRSIVYDDSRVDYALTGHYSGTFRIVKTHPDTIVEGAVEENVITLSVNDKKKTLPLPDGIWIQTPHALDTWVLSGEQSIAFWVASAETDDVIVYMKAKKKAIEQISIDGKIIDAMHVEVTLRGLKALFWKAHYWFRQEDGMLLKYRETRGGPGTKETIGEMVMNEVNSEKE